METPGQAGGDGPPLVQCGARHLKFWAFAKGGLAAVTPTLGSVKAKLSQHFLCVDFYPDGSALVGAASGDILHFRGKELSNVLGGAHEGFVAAVRVLPDGDSLCSGGKDGRLVVWGLGRWVSKPGCPLSAVCCLSASADRLTRAHACGRGGAASLQPVLEIELSDALGHAPGAGVYARAIGVNEAGSMIAVGSSRNDVVSRAGMMP
jgi:hypothetical protein